MNIDLPRPNRAVPVRYRIMIQSRGGSRFTYDVCTWLDAHKAVAWAALAYQTQNPDDPPYRVEVDELGPAPPTERGTYAPGPGELFDRWEW